jgi:hypothetical protein
VDDPEHGQHGGRSEEERKEDDQKSVYNPRRTKFNHSPDLDVIKIGMRFDVTCAMHTQTSGQLEGKC